MNLRFPFVDRDDEIQRLDGVLESIINGDEPAHYILVQGRRCVGKTSLIEHFLDRVPGNVSFRAQFKNFEPSARIIRYDCREEGANPYQAFEAVGRKIRESEGFRRILVKIARFILAVFSINDAITALENLAEEIKGKSSDEVERRKGKVFKKYLEELSNWSRQSPVFLYLSNIQWLDAGSLAILKRLMHGKGFQGIVFMEENDVANPNFETLDQLRRLTHEGPVMRLHVKAMEIGFEETVLRETFGDETFVKSDYETAYILCDGIPGLLHRMAEEWVHKGWLVRESGSWRKGPTSPTRSSLRSRRCWIS